MIMKTFFIVLTFIMMASNAFAKTIVFATDATWPPMEFMDENNQVVGFAVDYMEAAGREAGFTPIFKVVAWDGIFAGLDTGKYDAICSSVSITEKRKRAMDFSIPYYKVTQALVVLKDSPAKTLGDLTGRKVGVQIATTGHFAVKKADGITIKSYDEIGLAMEDLYNGRIDGVVCDDPVAAQYALTNEKYRDSLKIGGLLETEEVEYYGIATKRGNTQVLDLVNKGIQAVKAKEIDRKLLKKWIHQ